MVPDYLRHWLKQADDLALAEVHTRSDYREYVARMGERQIEELGRFYRKATEDGDLEKLNGWFRALNDGRLQDPDERPVRKLVLLFGHLGLSGYSPFTSYVFGLGRIVPPRPDWSKLPPDMAFLAAPAEKYGAVAHEQDKEAFAASMTPAARKEMQDIDDRCVAVGLGRIRSWYLEMGVAEHVEAQMVFSLRGLIAHCLPERYPM